MAFLRSISTINSSPTIRGERVLLRAPVPSDYPQWAKLREDSRAFLAPWEPIWPADDLTKMSFRRRIKRYQREIRNGTGYPFFIFSPDGETLFGGLTLAQVQRGVTQSSVLGYWMGAPFAGKGFMTAAVRGVIGFAFDSLALEPRRGRLPAATTRPPSASSKRSDLRARAMPADISASTDAGRIISSTAWCATIRVAERGSGMLVSPG